MRVKIKAPQHKINNLEFGKSYFLSYAGITLGEEFVFTRKNKIELCDYRIEQGKKIKVSSYWVSKRYLKDLINSTAIHWMAVFEEDE